nr:ribonuclease D [Spirochaeta isovalerica]
MSFSTVFRGVFIKKNSSLCIEHKNQKWGNKLTKYRYIQTDSEIQKFRSYLLSEQIHTLAMDFEGEFSLHQYGESLCLIQIFDGKNYFLIDPVHISTRELKMLLESTNIVKIFYDAQSDKALVFKKYDIEIQAILDLADPVYILEGQIRGLDAMIQKYLNITITQKKKFQKHNWTIRPIAEEALEYALKDVQYLFKLKDELMEQLSRRGLLEDYIRRLVTRDNKVKINPIPGIKRKKEYKKLTKEQKRTFDSLYEIREKYAEKLNWPPNNVISNSLLHKIATGGETLERSIHDKVPRKFRIDILREFKE